MCFERILRFCAPLIRGGSAAVALGQAAAVPAGQAGVLAGAVDLSLAPWREPPASSKDSRDLRDSFSTRSSSSASSWRADTSRRSFATFSARPRSKSAGAVAAGPPTGPSPTRLAPSNMAASDYVCKCQGLSPCAHTERARARGSGDKMATAANSE